MKNAARTHNLSLSLSLISVAIGNERAHADGPPFSPPTE